MRNKLIFLVILYSLLVSCKDATTTKITLQEAEVSVAENAALVPESWIKSRVEKAENRLNQSEAGRIVWNAMLAHGGLHNWYSNGALAFRFNYQPLEGIPRDSYQVINTWSNKAKHTSISDSTAHFGWTGKQAWVSAKDSTAFAYDTKFWALTPYYFLAQPFVLDGEGVNLEVLPSKSFNGKEQDVVKVTFDAGTGDAPDDYYILHFDADSHKLKVIRYIVSYPEYFKDGGHMPEKFMELLDEQNVEGILMPQSYKTYWLTDDEMPGEYITNIEVSDVSFKKELPKDYFEMPENAKRIE